MQIHVLKLTIAVFVGSLALVGCDSDTTETPLNIETKPVEAEKTQAVEPAAEEAPEAAKPKETPWNATKKMDWSIADQHRTAIETAIPEAKGFIDGHALTIEIFEKKITDRAEQRTYFAERTEGKYVYIAGQVSTGKTDPIVLPLHNERPLATMRTRVKAPKGYDAARYEELYGGTGYATAFVGKLSNTGSMMELEPAFDVFEHVKKK